MHQHIVNVGLVLLFSATVAEMVHAATTPHRAHPPYRNPPYRSLPYRASPALSPSLPQVWCLYSGKTLKGALTGWAQISGWSLHWNSSYDYPITVTTCFRGTFLQVLPGIAHAYRHANRPFYLDLYPKQRLAIISE